MKNKSLKRINEKKVMRCKKKYKKEDNRNNLIYSI